MRILLTTILSLWVASAKSQTPLTIERIYSDPSLSGPAIRGLEISPSGDRITYLKAYQDGNTQRYDLWEYHIAEAKHRILVDSGKLNADPKELSDDEKARRERMRISSSGFVDYQWDSKGQLILIPLDGDLYIYDLKTLTPKALTTTKTSEIDPKISPKGSFVSFVRDQNLFFTNLSNGQEVQISKDGGDTIRYGQAEFVAQEEMRRYTGYWWSPDEKKIAFTKVDEKPVAIEQRYEIYAEELKVLSQRYPKTGTANALIQLFIYDVASGKTTELSLGEQSDIYLAEVTWAKDSQHLLVQRQSRDQKLLDLLKYSVQDGKSSILLQERSDFWVDLHKDLRILKNNDFIWKSDREGTAQLYLYNSNGKLIRQLTKGDGVVKNIVGIDNDNRQVYYLANFDNPLETHLFRTDLESDKTEQLTKDKGSHSVTMDQKASLYIHGFSSSSKLPQIALRSNDGKLLTYLNENVLDQNHPYYPYSSNQPTVEFGKLTTNDGQALYYRLTKPQNFNPKKKYPVLVEVYGGPGVQLVQNAWGGGSFFWHQYLTERGYLIFSIDNRGSANRGVAFEKAIHRQLGHREIEDQIVGTKFLRSLPYVAKDKIGIFGWSYGGYMALMGMFQASDDYSAGIAVAPVTAWEFYDTHYTERFLETPKINPQGYEKSSVFPYVEQLKGPLLIVHGMADDNVLFSNATKLIQTLQDKAMPFEMMTYPGKKHGIQGKNTRIHLYKYVSDFLDRNLKNKN